MVFEEVKVSERTVEMTCELYALEMAVVSRGDVKDLSDQWNEPGIYLLLEAGTNSGWCAYVGQAKYLDMRILQDHSYEDFEWDRALLVRRRRDDRGSGGLDKAERGWLEGRMYELLKGAGVGLANKQRPDDDMLSKTKREQLEKYVEVIESALTLLRYPLGSQPQTPERRTKPSKERADRGQPVSRRNLLDFVSVDQEIESTSPKYSGATATIDASGGVRYRGRLYASLSAAAKAVTKQRTANGWSFWGVKDGGVLKKLEDLRDKEPSPDTQRASNTTPREMSRAERKRFFARRDAGATYTMLQEEFGLSKGSVANLLNSRS